MRLKVFIILSYIAILTINATNCSSFISSNKKIKIFISNNSFKIILLPSEETEKIQSQSDDKYIGEVIFLSNKITYVNDILIVKDGKRKYYFKIQNSEILIAQSNITTNIKKEDRFFCSYYKQPDGGFLSNGSWKNNQKDGKWIYRKNYQVFIYTFNKGKLISKKKISQ